MKQDQFNSIGLLVARLALGIIMFAHGAQKLFGWFDGYGWSGTMGWMTGVLGIPAFFAAIAILTEFFGGVMIIAGALTRLFTFLLLIEQIVAMMLVHWSNGFFLNWSPQMSQAGHGFEMNLALIGLVIGLFFTGPGVYALDAKFNLDFLGRLFGAKKAEPAMTN
jgi:putative oxidoreductase